MYKKNLYVRVTDRKPINSSLARLNVMHKNRSQTGTYYPRKASLIYTTDQIQNHF